jgi:hypothetical protein
MRQVLTELLQFEMKKQPGARLMVQETWLPTWPLGASNYPEAGCSPISCSNRDAATLPVLQKIHTDVETKYKDKLRTQLTELNAKTAANFTTLVPVWDLVVSLRESKSFTVSANADAKCSSDCQGRASRRH